MNLNSDCYALGKNISLIIFDLDGVLMDSRELHYQALNRALEAIDPKYVITREMHLSSYDGRPTSTKLNMLTAEKGLPLSLHDKIWKLKQEKTFEVINDTFQYDDRLRVVLAGLKKRGFQLYWFNLFAIINEYLSASNSIYNTLKLMLLRKGILEYFDYILSCEDVAHPKPAPDIYITCCLRANVSVSEAIILEDSHVGRKAALLSGCHLLPVENPESVTFERIVMTVDHINRSQNIPHQVAAYHDINIVIPMAGIYDDYRRAGFVYPGPLVEVNGRPMVQMVVENINILGNYIFIVRQEDYTKFQLEYLLRSVVPGCKIVVLEEQTAGQAKTVLAAKHLINNEKPLLIANCNQFMKWDSSTFLETCFKTPFLDGAILTFKNLHPRFSYVETDQDCWITNIEEKKTISDKACAGLYYMSSGAAMIKCLETLKDEQAVLGNFYVSTAVKEAIRQGFKIKGINVEEVWPLNFPKDLEAFYASGKHVL